MSERRLKLCVACSLDMYIAGTDEAIDWIADPSSIDLSAFFESIDTLIMGRKSYDLCVAMGQTEPMPGTTQYVFTNREVEPNEHATFVSGDPAELIAELRAGDGRDIWLFGGGDLTAQCLAADLVDDIIVGLHPIVLGGGIPLFPGEHDRRPFDLVGLQRYDSGVVTMHYQRSVDT